MATLNQVIDGTLDDYLLTGQREPRNVLASSPNASETALTLTYTLRGVQEASRVAVDYEDMHVVGSDPAAKEAKVIRGQYGTSAAAHTAGATVWVNPKWSRAQVLRAVNDEIRGLSAIGLYRMAATDLTFQPAKAGYDLTGVTPDDVLGVYEVLADTPGPSSHWQPISSWRLVRDAPAADFPSGLGLVLNEPGFPGHTVRVLYKRRFSPVTADDAATDLATSAGVDVEAHDIVSVGAAVRLVTGKEIGRSQLHAQPDTRRAEDVPPGAVLGSSRGLISMWERRVAEEKSRLARRYPSKGRRPGVGVSL